MKDIEAAGLTLVAISYDSTDNQKKYAQARGITFPMLSDAGSRTIDAYGIRNKAMNGLKFGTNDLTGVAHPGTYLLDHEGIVRAKLFLERYQVRHTVEELINAAKSYEY